MLNLAMDDEARLKQAGLQMRCEGEDQEEGVKVVLSVILGTSDINPLVLNVRRACLLTVNVLSLIPLSQDRPQLRPADISNLLGGLMIHLAKFDFELASVLVSEMAEVMLVLRDLVNMREQQPAHVLEFFRSFLTVVKRSFTSNARPVLSAEDPSRGILWSLNSFNHTRTALLVLVGSMRIFFDELGDISDLTLCDKACEAIIAIWPTSPPSIVMDTLRSLEPLISENLRERLSAVMNLNRMATDDGKENTAVGFAPRHVVKISPCTIFDDLNQTADSDAQVHTAGRSYVASAHASSVKDVIQGALRYMGSNSTCQSSLYKLLHSASAQGCRVDDLAESRECVPGLLATPAGFLTAKLLRGQSKELTFAAAFAAIGAKRREMEIVASYVCGYESLGEAMLACLQDVLTVLFLTRAVNESNEADALEAFVLECVGGGKYEIGYLVEASGGKLLLSVLTMLAYQCNRNYSLVKQAALDTVKLIGQAARKSSQALPSTKRRKIKVMDTFEVDTELMSLFVEENFLHVLQICQDSTDAANIVIVLRLLMACAGSAAVDSYAAKTIDVLIKIPHTAGSVELWEEYISLVPRTTLISLLPAVLLALESIHGGAVVASRVLAEFVRGSIPGLLALVSDPADSSQADVIASFVLSELRPDVERPVTVKVSVINFYCRFLRRTRSQTLVEVPREIVVSISEAALAFLKLGRNDEDVKNAVASLLGELGVSELRVPDRLSVDSRLDSPSQPISNDNAVRSMALRILVEFISPKLKLDSHALCAQEILVVSGGSALLADIPSAAVQAMLKPYLSSHYKYSGEDPQDDRLTIPSVILWISDSLPSSNCPIKKLLHACKQGVIADPGLAFYLLPVAVEALVVHGPDDEIHRTLIAQAKQKLVGSSSLLTGTDSLGVQAAIKCLDHLGQFVLHQKGGQLARHLLEDLPLPTLIHAAMRTSDWTRALFYAEARWVTDSGDLRPLKPEDCHQLGKIFEGLGQADGLAGLIAAFRKPPHANSPIWLRLEAMWFEMSSQWDDALQRYEGALNDPRGLCRVLIASGKYQSAIALAKSEPKLNVYGCEASWKLRDWSGLSQYLDSSKGLADVSRSISKALASLQVGENLDNKLISDCRCILADSLLAAQRVSTLSQLHIISDIEWLSNAPGRERDKSASVLLRRAAMAPDEVRADILQAASAAACAIGRMDHVEEIETELLRACRKTGSLTLAKQLLVTQLVSAKDAATVVNLHAAWRKVLQLAKVNFEIGQVHAGRDNISRGLEVLGSGTDASWTAECVSLKWACKLGLQVPRQALADFRDLVRRGSGRPLSRDREKVHFHFAEYLDGFLQEMMDNQKSKSSTWSSPHLAAETIRQYISSLANDVGFKRVLITVNRVLQIYSDTAVMSDDLFAKVSAELRSSWKSVSHWHWYVGLQQLIPRLISPQGAEDPVITDIITGVMRGCPDHASWYVVPILSSSNAPRKAAAMRICEATLPGKTMEKMKVMIDSLVGIARCRLPVPKDSKKEIPMEKLSQTKDGQKLVSHGGGCKFIVPLQSQIGYVAALAGTRATNLLTIHSWLDPVKELSSKAAPKKLTLLDSNGKEHTFLCKSERKSDLRKDARMMEFANVLNREIFAKDMHAAKKGLSIRTYSVVPLTEDAAIIEWLSNLVPLRTVLDDGLQRRGLKMGTFVTREIQEQLVGPNGHEAFVKILSQCPPVLQKWFINNFPNSTSWFDARLKYTTSLAVWSMVGFTVGLGDRHCENILLDQLTGAVVHVDFDCIFGRGMSLQTPELVPFRLTSNCVAALGITGIEGEFRKSCELVMSLLRKRRKLILSVLGAFVADRLIDWQVPGDSAASGTRRAQEALNTIDRKLQGMVNLSPALVQSPVDEPLLQFKEKNALGRDRGSGLSVAAQVDELIKSAICTRNLSKMYLGWMPMF